MAHFSDSDDEAALQQAIALSLQSATSSPARRTTTIIDLVSDDEDGDLKTSSAIVTGRGLREDATIPHYQQTLPKLTQFLQNQAPAIDIDGHDHDASDGAKHGIGSPTVSSPRSNESAKVSQPVSSFVALDRKKMEDDRFERLKQKRNRSISPPATRDSKRAKILTPSPSLSNESGGGKVEKEATVRNFHSNLELEEPSGYFLIPKSLMVARPVSLTDIKQSLSSLARVEEDPHSLKWGRNTSQHRQHMTLATGIQYPDGVVKKTWAFGYPRENDIKIEEVLQKNDLDLAVLSAFQWDDSWILSKLDMKRTKIICVVQSQSEEEASANLVPYDWGETGVMENMVFIIDLPRWPNGRTCTAEEFTPFGRDLQYYLTAMGMQKTVIESMVKFDFSRTKQFAFVHTIGGSHTGEAWERTGYCGLGSAIKELGLATEDPLELDFVCGGTICFQSRWYDSAKFPRKCMRDCKSRRSGMLMHNKHMIADHPKSCFSFVPVGEHRYMVPTELNMQRGPTLVAQIYQKVHVPFPASASRKTPEMEPRSAMEKPFRGLDDSEHPVGASFSMDIFGAILPVPMVTPGEEYDGKRPWYYSEG